MSWSYSNVIVLHYTHNHYRAWYQTQDCLCLWDEMQHVKWQHIRSPSPCLSSALSERNDQTEQEERREIKQRLNRKVNSSVTFHFIFSKSCWLDVRKLLIHRWCWLLLLLLLAIRHYKCLMLNKDATFKDKQWFSKG